MFGRFYIFRLTPRTKFPQQRGPTILPRTGGTRLLPDLDLQIPDQPPAIIQHQHRRPLPINPLAQRPRLIRQRKRRRLKYPLDPSLGNPVMSHPEDQPAFVENLEITVVFAHQPGDFGGGQDFYLVDGG